MNTPDDPSSRIDMTRGHASVLAQPHDCFSCLVLQLHLWVSMNATAYVSTRIKPTALRLVVVEDVARAWLRCIEDDDHVDGFGGFFNAYCQQVEQAVDPSLQNTHDHEREYRRVWMEHALALSDA